MPPIMHQNIPSKGERNAKAIPVPTKNLDEDHKKMEIRRSQDDMHQR
jgi:hypothetical protein